MAYDQKGAFARPNSLGNFDGGTFEWVPPAFIVSSDFPAAIGSDGGLYYVPYKESGVRELIRRTPRWRPVCVRRPSFRRARAETDEVDQRNRGRRRRIVFHHR